MKNKGLLSSVFTYTLLIVISFLAIFPAIWMVIVSLKPASESLAGLSSLIIQNPTLQNYIKVNQLAPMMKPLMNSVIVTVLGTVTTLFFCSLAGFAFAKFRFPGRDILFMFVIATMLIPQEAAIVPVFTIMKNLGIANSLWSLIIPRIATAMGIFYMRQYIMAVPDEIIEAARIDGCKDFRIYSSIVLPVIKPAMASWASLTMIARWNDFFWPLIFMRSPDKYTIMVTISLLPVGEGLSTPWPVIMAGTSLAVVPIIVVYLICQRFQIAGLLSGAVKG